MGSEMCIRDRSGIIKNKDRPWRDRDHALFVGFAPAEAPRYAVAVVVEHGGGGSTVAAPIAADVMVEALQIDPGPIGEAPPPFTPPLPVTEQG